MSISRNKHVSCHSFYKVHVDCRIAKCRIPILRNHLWMLLIFFLMLISLLEKAVLPCQIQGSRPPRYNRYIFVWDQPRGRKGFVVSTQVSGQISARRQSLQGYRKADTWPHMRLMQVSLEKLDLYLLFPDPLIRHMHIGKYYQPWIE